MNLIAVLLVSLVLAFPQEATTQEAPTALVPVSTKIGFVDTSAILQGTAEGKKELAAVESFTQSRQNEIQTLSEEVKTLKDQFAQQGRMLNPGTRAEMERQIADKEKRLTRSQEDLQLALSNRQSRLLSSMADKIREVIEEYARSNGFGVVFIIGPSTPYFASSVDLTSTIIEAYDAKYPVTSPGTGR